MKVANEILVVTGAGSGIGREVVFQALRRGAKVAACDINAATLEDTQRPSRPRPTDRLSTHPLDVADREAVEALPGAVIALRGGRWARPLRRHHPALPAPQGPRLSGLRAGHGGRLAGHAVPDEDLQVDPPRPAGGQIVNVSSLGGLLPVPG
jgi:NAD(P)-dependent dehydrogenase (short-subunit alcohol dehydrogenase family)